MAVDRCPIPGCECASFAANPWAPGKCRDCLHPHSVNNGLNKSDSMHRSSGRFSASETARVVPGANAGSESAAKPPVSAASAASSTSSAGSKARKWMSDKKKSFASIRGPRGGGEAGIIDSSDGSIPSSSSGDSPLVKKNASNHSFGTASSGNMSGSPAFSSSLSSASSLSQTGTAPAASKSWTSSASASASSSRVVTARSVPKKSNPAVIPSPSLAPASAPNTAASNNSFSKELNSAGLDGGIVAIQKSTVPPGWGFDLLTQLCRCYLTDVTTESAISFHPQISAKKVAAIEKTFGEIGWRRLSPSEATSSNPASDFRPCCVYDNVLFGSGGRAREIIVLTPGGVYWKNLTGTTPRFAAWAEVDRDSVEISRRRIRFAVISAFTHASIDFYKTDTPIKDSLADLFADILRRAPTPSDLDPSAPWLSRISNVSAVSSLANSSSSNRSDISRPTFVRRLGPDAALRQVYGSTAVMLPGDDPNTLTLRVQFPEGFPLDFKTLVVKNAHTTPVSSALDQLKANVPKELWDHFFRNDVGGSRDVGFFVAADQTWLKPTDNLGAYKGLWMIKKVDVRPLAQEQAATASSSDRPFSQAKKPSNLALNVSSGSSGSVPSFEQASAQIVPSQHSIPREVEALQQRIRQLEAQLGTSQLTLQMTQEELEAISSSNTKLETQVDYFKKQLGAARVENEQLKAEFTTMEKMMEAQADRFAEGLQRLSVVARTSINLSTSAAPNVLETSPVGQVAVFEGEIDDIFAGFG